MLQMKQQKQGQQVADDHKVIKNYADSKYMQSQAKDNHWENILPTLERI